MILKDEIYLRQIMSISGTFLFQDPLHDDIRCNHIKIMCFVIGQLQIGWFGLCFDFLYQLEWVILHDHPDLPYFSLKL